ncbi:breast cancer type 2 susceptibility protein-like isoform X2 [Pseudomyrmex gracilis]|uniref:breast cancer type 2 susceptibility protein-like isoform X2 n=1 Tax=Pseudomyrmex gracilis TaxID=219809 RepID=UPI000995B42F|nr:breast cancer type 2 susceptibility protein-like isoform X2 [Pseudomyrmex gracilis]
MDTKARFSDRNAKKNLSTSDNADYESDELFSDDEQKREIQCQSENSQDVKVPSLSETPSMLLSNSYCAVTHNATVPSTPLSLLPFLNKINEQWTSDLETPQAQSHDISSTSATKTQETPKLEQCTSEVSDKEIDVDDITSASPVIVSKAMRRRPKRRIFRSSLSIDPQFETSNEDVTANANIEISVNSESLDSVIQHDATCVISVVPDGNVFKDCESDILNKTQDNSNDKESENLIMNTSNSSTQEFFKNASFSKIDELCSDNFDKQAATGSTIQYNQKDAVENIEKKSDAEENINIDFSSARGTLCKISKQAALKAKRLFADVFDADEMQDYESFAKKSFIEQKHEHSRSLANNSPVNVTTKETQATSTEQVNQFETKHNIKLPSIQRDFQIACGSSMKISESSFSKTKTLFAERLNDISDKDTFDLEELPEENASPAKQLNESKNKQDVKLPSVHCGFQTARGSSINILESSLSRAKTLFAEQLNDISEKNIFGRKLPEEKTLLEEQLNDQSKNKQETKSPNVQCGFQTVRDTSTKISRSLSKTKTSFEKLFDDVVSDKENFEQKLSEETALFAEELNDESKIEQEMELPSVQCGFQTARGSSIKISESSISKAKALFAEQLNTFEKDIFGQELPEEKASLAKQLNIQSKNKQDVNLPSVQCGFQTARGSSINIFESSLSKAKTLFAEQLNNISDKDTFGQEQPEEKSSLAEEVNIQSKNKQDVKLPSVQCGFQTARGSSINIFESSLSKAKTLFAEQLNNISDKDTFGQEQPEERASLAKQINIQTKNKQDVKLPSVQCGFQTARGSSINIFESSLSKAKAFFAEQLNTFDKDTFDLEELPEEKSSLAEEVNIQSKNKQDVKLSSVQCGFQTARGSSINILESSLSKAKTLFAEQLNNIFDKDTFGQEQPEERASFAEQLNDQSKNKQGVKLSSVQCGFQTVRDTSTKISRSLSKAKASVEEQFDDVSDKENFEQELSEETALFAEELNDEFKIKQETKELPNVQCGFQTARGASVKISQSALSKAQALFNNDLNYAVSKSVSAENNNHFPIKEFNREEEADSGRGSAMSNYSAQTLPKAKITFAKRLTSPLESVVTKRNNVIDKIGNSQFAELSSVGREIQTARDTSVKIPRRVLYRPKTLLANRLDYSSEVNVRENIDLEDDAKRCDSTTSGIQQVLINVPPRERARLDDCSADENSPDLMYASWLQKRKSSDPASSNSDENTPLGARNREFKRHESKKARLSNELQARKLFPDDANADENPNENKQLSFVARSGSETPKQDVAEPNESEAAGSPVIGTKKTVCRKRRSFEHRGEKKSGSQENANEAPIRENVSENASRERNDDLNELEDAKKTGDFAPGQNAKTENVESIEYDDTQLMMNFVDQSVKILQDRLAATLEQESVITAKRRHGCKQSVGHLYRYKEANAKARLSLKDIGNGAPPVPLTSRELIERRVPPNVLTITSATAASYKFQCSDFYGSDVARSNVRGIEMGDGARLIMDENGYVGIWEFQRCFLASTGVDPNLVPARWIENHYRWIVWKLASMDRMKFGSAELPRSLTPSHVMTQLKYRYDREIDRSQRPALRRILEKDDVASKRMILCVSSVIENDNASSTAETSPPKSAAKWKIELTDGWYGVAACVDVGMVKNLLTGKVKEGTKLVMSGAELLNCDQGCYPLEVTADVCLKLHTNSTRRARWHAKLGYTPRSGPIPIRLRNVCPNGGLIGKMTVLVARVYPMLYHERTASGDSVVRNAKCEEKAQSKYEQQCWSDIEKFYAKAEKDFQDKVPSDEIDGMTIQLNEDYENLSSEDFVSEQRHNELMQELRQKEERFKQQLQSKLRQSLPGPRQVSPLLKVRVCDDNANAILSIWLPSEEIVDTVKEGACVSLRNVVASGKRGSELQLTAGRCAIFKPDKRSDMSHPPRTYTPLREITSSEFAPPYGEFDTIGFVCSVGPAPYGMKDFEVAHIAYPNSPSSNDTSYLSILFWQGISNYGYTEILIVGSVVACANLEWRRASSWNIPVAYCTERSTFTRNPRRNHHLYEPFENLRGLITNPIEYAKERASELNVELQKKATPTRYASNKNTPIKTTFNSTLNFDKKPTDSPLLTPKPGLGITSNYVPSNSTIQKRLEKLQYLGEPPKLSPLVIRNSKRMSLQFRSPVCVSNSTENNNNSSRASQSGDPNASQ